MTENVNNQKQTDSDQRPKGFFDDAPLIYQYTRKQALDDGVLVDLTPWAQETGFQIPVACTRSVWDGYLEPPKGTEAMGQSLRGRAHDLLWMLYVAIRKTPGTCGSLAFEVIFFNRRKEHETVKLKAICGPGDQAEPVITAMLPHDD